MHLLALLTDLHLIQTRRRCSICLPIHVGSKAIWDVALQTARERRHFFEMKRLVVVAFLLVASGCGNPGPSPVAGTPLTVPELKFAVMDALGKPQYCDPDFWPLAHPEMPGALQAYPTIRSDTVTYEAILAHEHLPPTDLTDDQKLAVYRAWKLLRALQLTKNGNEYSFEYRVLQGTTVYQMVEGTVRDDGVVTLTSRKDTTRPMCPICLAASTLIASPGGDIRVTDIREGSIVWTLDADGSRVAAPVVEIGSMEAPVGHRMVHLLLADGRQLLVSPGHRTADGRQAGNLRVGDQLDGSKITTWELVPYAGGRTYDLLPAGATGFYWANGILMSSTITAPRTS